MPIKIITGAAFVTKARGMMCFRPVQRLTSNFIQGSGIAHEPGQGNQQPAYFVGEFAHGRAAPMGVPTGPEAMAPDLGLCFGEQSYIIFWVYKPNFVEQVESGSG